jgi:hypothetical protein
MGILIVVIGVITTVIGGALMLLERSGFKGLPGDIFVQKGGVTFFFPVISCIVISIVLTIVLNLWKR